MEIVGEFQSIDTDKGIWRYFRNHWHEWFPRLGSRSQFAKQAANFTLSAADRGEREALWELTEATKGGLLLGGQRAILAVSWPLCYWIGGRSSCKPRCGAIWLTLYPKSGASSSTNCDGA